MNEEACVAGGAPGRDPRRDARGGHGGFQRAHQVVLFGNLEREVVRARLDHHLEPRHAKPNAGNRRLDLLEDLSGRLAWVDAAVDLDHAAVRHDVRTRAAVDRPDRQARGAKHRMRAPRKLVVDGLQLDHDRRGSGDRVASQRGRRCVRRRALDNDPKVQQAPVARARVPAESSSSPATAASVTSPAGSSPRRRSSKIAPSIAASPPFMSHAPRP